MSSTEEVLTFEGELESTVDDILNTCEKFRILVVGRSGVGKSHLVNAVFGAQYTVVEHGRTAGISDIRREMHSEQNPRLILHDSQGFSHGDAANFETVKKFIHERSSMPQIKDRLHAIWLCTTTPAYGEPLLEIGDEQILRLQKDIGVPIIVVLTKFDQLVTSLMPPVQEEDLYGDVEEGWDMNDSASDTSSDPATPVAQVVPIDKSILSLAKAKLREFVTSEEKLNGFPWVAISVQQNYADTLDELIETTRGCIDQSVRVLWAITQQKSTGMKIKASIDIGKQRYWRGLSTAVKLPGRSLHKWLAVVHKEIVQLWGLYDPDKILAPESKITTATISALQADLVEKRSGILQHVSAGTITTVAGIVSGIVPPAAPFAMPIAVGLVFATWVYEAVAVTPAILRGMMGYIVDLTIVMQKLFELALRSYTHNVAHSPSSAHDAIRSFATRSKAFKSQEVIKEVERLIEVYRFQPSEHFVTEAKGSVGSETSTTN